MREKLQAALKQLEAAGVTNRYMPDHKEVEKAASGTKWEGKKPDGYRWELLKRGENDYKVKC